MKKKITALLLTAFMFSAPAFAHAQNTKSPLPSPDIKAEKYRRVCPEGLFFSIALPEAYVQKQAQTNGRLSFSSENGRIDIDVARKSEQAGMTAWLDYADRMTRIDSENAQFSRIIPHTYASVDAFSYTVTTDNAWTYYGFFVSGDNVNGDFVYRITITQSQPMTGEQERAIMNSIVARPPAKETAAALVSFLPQEGSFQASADDCTFTVPNTYIPSIDGKSYYNRTTGASLSFLRTKERVWKMELSRKHAQEITEQAKANDAVILQKAKKTDVGKTEYYVYALEETGGIREYGFTASLKGREIMIQARVPALYDTEAFREELENIVVSRQNK